MHMRGHSTRKPHRANVRITFSIGDKTFEKSFRAKGISRDGPAIEAWAIPLAQGDQSVAVRLFTGPDARPSEWVGVITAENRTRYVLTYDPTDGFRPEWD